MSTRSIFLWLQLQAEIKRLGADNIVCVMTSTSCFAPRGTDPVVEIAVLCDLLGVPHLVNNAYGVQSSMLTGLLSSALRKGRVDGIIQVRFPLLHIISLCCLYISFPCVAFTYHFLVLRSAADMWVFEQPCCACRRVRGVFSSVFVLSCFALGTFLLECTWATWSASQL